MNEEVKFERRPTKESRRPFGSQVQKLAYANREGYHRHWFRDDPGRIELALEAGYTHVQDKAGAKVKRVTGVNNAGGPQHSWLMEIPEEWYKEDMATAQREVDARDAAVMKQDPKDKGLYIKQVDIKHGVGGK